MYAFFERLRSGGRKQSTTQATSEGAQSTPQPMDDLQASMADATLTDTSSVQHPGGRLALPAHRWLVAIDIGTAYSGYASFLTDGKLQTISAFDNWEGMRQPGCKTRTCVLLDEQQELVMFGAAAEEALSEMDEEQWENVYFFKNFKMSLYKDWNDASIEETAVLTAINGRTARAVKVFALSIKYMRDTFAKQLKASTGHALAYEDVLWVVTVPAIWRDDAKQFMREAVYEAGLVKKADPNRLILALESESAGVFCDNLLLPKKEPTLFKGHNALSTLKSIEPGDKYMIVDCGGGTVDIAVHERMPNRSVREAASRGGRNAGGEDINKKFEEFLAELLPDDGLKKLKSQDPVTYLEQCNEFESGKRTVRKTGTTMYGLNVRTAAGLESFLHEKGLPDVKTLLQNYKGGLNVKWNRGYFKFTFGLEEGGFFSQPLKDIKKEVTIVLDTLKRRDISLSRVFYVGGFSECTLLQDALTAAVKEYQPEAQILVPEDCGLAVLKGAVLFGRNPEAVSERVSVYTYGVRTDPDFVTGVHDKTRRSQVAHNKIVCEGVFHHIVRAGQIIKQGQVIGHIFAPQRADASSFEAEIYESKEQSADTLYIDDPEVRRVGALELAFTGPPADAADRNVEVEFSFDQTEIHVQATECATGQQVKTDIKFMFESPTNV